MEIITCSFTINNHQFDDTQPTNIELISTSHDNKIIFKYNLNDNYYYVLHSPHKKNHFYIFFEILNKSLLWNIKYTTSKINQLYFINYKIEINVALIDIYIQSSLGLNNLLIELYNKIPNVIKADLINKSILPFCEPYIQPLNFKIQLYDYQLRSLNKMIQIENKNICHKVNYTYDIQLYDKNIIYDPIANIKIDNHMMLDIKTDGGILADEMGLGKTISCISLIVSNPQTIKQNFKLSKKLNVNKVSSKATLIICPSHLTKQWVSEINKSINNLKIIVILSKNDFSKLIFEDIINCDIVITSYQFLMNFKYYPNIYYFYDISHSPSVTNELSNSTPATFNPVFKNNSLKNYLNSNLGDYNKLKKKELPLLEFFYFHRIIIDEGHEIFGQTLNNCSLNKYMTQWILNIDADFHWYISGTPFINLKSIQTCANFINLNLNIIDKNINFNHNNINNESNIFDFMNKQYIWNNILEKICIRHLKRDIENQIDFYGYEEEIIWLKFTELEKQLYESKKNKVSKQYLQQLCCHPLVVESSRKIFGNVEVDLSIMQDKLIEYHKNNYENYKNKLENLNPTRQEYHMLKKTYETQINESKYLFTILEKIKSSNILENENCSICMDELSNPTLTTCGHLYCYECLKLCLNQKKICPICKSNLSGKDLMIVNYTKNNDLSNPLIDKYGSKLGKLISLINCLLLNKDSRIIIFSQWDDMLNLVGKTLGENNISNSFVKGNVWSRNSAIDKFKNSDENKIIMLSLKNAASGTNLTEATHIIFIEPINEPKEEIISIESQAIARACRVGQKHKIKIIRILMQNTIEEEIYNQYYISN